MSALELVPWLGSNSAADEPDPGPTVRPLFVIVTDDDQYYRGSWREQSLGFDGEYTPWGSPKPHFTKNPQLAIVFETRRAAERRAERVRKRAAVALLSTPT